MILTRSSADVQRNASKAYKAIWNTAFMGRHAGVPAPTVPDALYPDAYIIEQGPGVTLPPHFHNANEFQLVVIGGGMLGKAPVQAYYLHYAGAFTPYGPIVPGPEGIGYMTLRATYDSGAKELPAKRDELRAGGRKPRARAAAVELGESRTVFPAEPDGLAASLHHVPANGSVAGPDPASGGGQFWIVLDGTMRTPAGESLPARSCVFVSADEAAYRAEAPQGASLDVLVVQYPAER